MFQSLRTASRYRGLLGTLIRREVTARYRGSALGFLWSLVNPLMLTAVYSLVFGTILGPRLGELGESFAYPLYLISGLFPWIFTSAALLEGTVSLSVNSGLIRKAAFPCALLPMVSVGANLVHFLFALPVLVGALLIGRAMGYPVLGWSSVAMVGVLALHVVTLTGMALGLAALNVHFKDVRDLLTNLLTLLFFLAPIIYRLDNIPVRIVQIVIRLNPFTPFVLAYQDTLFFGQLPDAFLWLQMLVVTVVAWTLGTLLFSRLEDTLVEAV